MILYDEVFRDAGLVVANLVGNPGIPGDSRGPEFPWHQ